MFDSQHELSFIFIFRYGAIHEDINAKNTSIIEMKKRILPFINVTNYCCINKIVNNQVLLF